MRKFCMFVNSCLLLHYGKVSLEDLEAVVHQVREDPLVFLVVLVVLDHLEVLDHLVHLERAARLGDLASLEDQARMDSQVCFFSAKYLIVE